MLRIRLRRTGKKHQPHYRLVIAEHTAPIKGKFIAVVGHYNPRSKELVLKQDEILKWLDTGAQPSNTVAKLLVRDGMKHAQIKIRLHPESTKKSAETAPKEKTEMSAEPQRQKKLDAKKIDSKEEKESAKAEKIEPSESK
ncbi:30S ribosomal protein S16 [Candidatus Berkelbacteria bacterium]|nr:30S ribosomal protein S16 [Candidatus Berkelbacteria bacterium]